MFCPTHKTAGSTIAYSGDAVVFVFLQVKLSVFVVYMKSIGILISLIIIFLYIVNTTASVFANFWLSAWSNDIKSNSTENDHSQRDMRLGVYGALGLAQGTFIVVIWLRLR